MTPPEIIIPMLSANGTPGTALLDGYINAMDALRKARSAMDETAPHGRDYPTTDILQMATTHHRIRLGMIDQIIDDFYKIGLAVGAETRKRRRQP
jgi:hypothetical protein